MKSWTVHNQWLTRSARVYRKEKALAPSVWGYARVSREYKHLALQRDALEAAGVIRANIVEEHAHPHQRPPLTRNGPR